MGYTKPVKIEALIGRTFASVTETDATVTFAGDGGPSYRLKHMQDCCESVWLEDVAGDLDDLVGSPVVMAEESTEWLEDVAGDLDDLVGSPVVMAEESTDKDATGVESTTWTFYKLGTAKGYVTLRWCGMSNGYYGEEVELFELEGEST